MSANRKAEVDAAAKESTSRKTNTRSSSTRRGQDHARPHPRRGSRALQEHALSGEDRLTTTACLFHRIIKGFMIQGGCPLGTGTGGPGYTIKAEFNTTPHEPGVLSMARTNDPNSAGSQFFICLEKHTHLDRQYTAFGKTADAASLAVVAKIGEVKTDNRDRPVSDVTINSATVIATPK